MSPVARMLRSLGHKRWFVMLMRRPAPLVDRVAHRLSGGRVHITNLVMPTLMLTHRGRRSGRVFRTPLLYVTTPGGGWAVAGTNFGQDHPPAWALNLAVNPDTEIEIKGRTLRVRARPASGQEREQLWPDLVRTWPPMDTYRRRVTRDIPLYILEPVGQE